MVMVLRMWEGLVEAGTWEACAWGMFLKYA